MPRKIGPTIGIDGEKKYRDEINRIIQQAKTLDAEMKATAAAFDKDASAKDKAAASSKNLEKAIANQEQYVARLAEMVERSAEKTDENSTATLQWKEALANAQAEMATMKQRLAEAVSEMESMDDAAEDTTEAIEEIPPAADKATDSTRTFGETLKAILTADLVKAGAKAVVKGFEEIGKAALSFGEEVVMSFADFEQLEGGVKKLFGDDDARQVIKNAENAFKTAGLSANEYMETVTGFSAALINSLGGDTERAAKLADVAIRDMSDNANTFGTDMQSLQNAYAGFAKGQFNMLDNLKLGYAGSKEGMEQLLADAQAISGIEFNIDSYADIVQAINVVQKNMGIAGTTAREAAGTISGSIDALKSSFQNFVTGLGQDGADIDMLFNNMAESFQNVVANVQPVVERLIDYLPGVVANLMPVISSMLPELVAVAGELFSQFTTTIIQLLPELVPVAVQAIMTIGGALVENAPLLAKAAWELIKALVSGIADLLGRLDEVGAQLSARLEASVAAGWGAMKAAGAQLIANLVAGIVGFASNLANTGRQIVTTIYSAFSSGIASARSWGAELITNFGAGIADYAKQVWEEVKNFAKGIWELLHFSEPEKGPLKDFNSWAPDMMKQYAAGIRSNAFRVQEAAEAAATGVEVGLSAVGEGAQQNAYNYGGISLIVNQQPGQSTEALVDEIMFRIQDAVDSRKAVFAS